MKWSVKLLAVAVLAVVLAVSSVQNAFAVTELKYDDGSAEFLPGTCNQGCFVAVKFVLADFGLSGQYTLLAAKFYDGTVGGSGVGGQGNVGWGSGSPSLGTQAPPTSVSFRGHVLDSNGVTELVTPFIVNVPVGPNQWVVVDLSGYNIVVKGSFYIAQEWLQDQFPGLGGDEDNIGQTYVGTSGNWVLSDTADAMVRADVGQVAAVGGTVMEPSLTTGLFAMLPWILIAAVAIGAGSYAMRKRYASPLLARIR